MVDLELIDNDVLFKVACFNLGEALQHDFRNGTPVRLGVAPFVLRSKIKRSRKLKDRSGAQERLESILGWAIEIEPDAEELGIAADIEGLAQQHNLPFDGGESLLLAMMIKRRGGRLHTGDKRAIASMPQIAELAGQGERLIGRVRCFEQILLVLLDRLGAEALTRGVCRESEVDQASSICCGCLSGGSNAAAIASGLRSYVEDLRRQCGSLLIA